MELLEKFKFRAEEMQIREMSLEELEDFRNEISGKVKAEQIRETKASVVATACANCKKQLHEISEHYRLGVEVVGVSDLAAQALTG